MVALLLVLPFLFAALYRVRGSANPHLGTTEARLLYWALPCGIVTSLATYLYGFSPFAGMLGYFIAWGGIALGHSFAQNNSKSQFALMGLVEFTRLAGLFLPLQIANIWHPSAHIILWALPVLHFFLCWGASALSYGSLFQSHTLTIFGKVWCSPGGSEWEELLNGACYGFGFAILLMDALLFHSA